MIIYVHHDGQQLGPWTEVEIKAQLAAGAISPRDLVWWEGQAGWVPLQQTALAGNPVPPMPPPVVPPVPFGPGTGTGVAPGKRSVSLPVVAVIVLVSLFGLAFVAVVAISVLLALGQTVHGVFSTINSQLAQAQGS